jgi:hypothetical protein
MYLNMIHMCTLRNKRKKVVYVPFSGKSSLEMRSRSPILHSGYKW